MKFVSTRQINFRSFTGREWREFKLLQEVERLTIEVAYIRSISTLGWGFRSDPRHGRVSKEAQLDAAIAACVAFDEEMLTEGHTLFTVLQALLDKYVYVLNQTV